MRRVDQPVSPNVITACSEFGRLDDRTQEVQTGESAQNVVKIAKNAAIRVIVTVIVVHTNLRADAVLSPQILHHLLQETVADGSLNGTSSSADDGAWSLSRAKAVYFWTPPAATVLDPLCLAEAPK